MVQHWGCHNQKRPQSLPHAQKTHRPFITDTLFLAAFCRCALSAQFGMGEGRNQTQLRSISPLKTLKARRRLRSSEKRLSKRSFLSMITVLISHFDHSLINKCARQASIAHIIVEVLRSKRYLPWGFRVGATALAAQFHFPTFWITCYSGMIWAW